MYTYRLVYVLATQNGSSWDLICDQEFANRPAVREYIEERKDSFTKDVYILRKEVAYFYDQKVIDINEV
jgi:hypothetical protein